MFDKLINKITDNFLRKLVFDYLKQRLIEEQVDLDEDVLRVLNENRWEMYDNE